MAYSEKVLEHYERPRNIGSLDDGNSSIGTGLVGAPECGDVMKLQIEVKDNKIVDAKFKTFGCGSAIAASSLATEWVKDKSIDDALTNSECVIIMTPWKEYSKINNRLIGKMKKKVIIDSRRILVNSNLNCDYSALGIGS